MPNTVMDFPPFEIHLKAGGFNRFALEDLRVRHGT